MAVARLKHKGNLCGSCFHATEL